MADSTSVGVLTNIFTAPSGAFAAIKERPNPWVPLLVIMIGSFAVTYVYLNSVDFPWLLDQQLQQAGNLTEQQRTQMVDGATRLPSSVLSVLQAGFAAVGILITYAVFALYYTIVSFATHDGIKFGQWLSLLAWCSLPRVFSLVASFVNMQVSDVRFMPPEALNPLSFGNLLAIEVTGASAPERFLLNLDVTWFWSTVLLILGYHAFRQRSMTTAAIVVLAPYAALGLIVALVVAL
jgi:Yip1-like protein